MQHIIICEDSSIQADYLKQEVLKLELPNISCEVYNTTMDLLENLSSMNAYSIFLLDIMMPEINGIELAKEINRVHPHACIIFVTAYLNTIGDAQDVNHCYFLLKKELKQRLPIALDKAINTIKNSKKTILVSQGSEKVVINIDDILYLERVKRYTFIVLEHEKLRVKEDFTILATLLPNNFYRCHHSFMVNFDKVSAMKKQSFLIHNGQIIPISRSYQKKCEKAFHEYVVQTL